MATQKDIKAFLKEAGLKESDIDKMWEEAAPKNFMIEQLIAQNVSWKKLNIVAIKQIPDEKEKQIKRAEKKRIEDEAAEKLRLEQEALAKAKLDILENEDLLLERILAKDLTDSQKRSVIFEDSVAEVIDTIEGDSRRWVKGMNTIVKVEVASSQFVGIKL